MNRSNKQEYEEFFKDAMKKFKIKSLNQLSSTAAKKKFFNYVDKNYAAKNENIVETNDDGPVTDAKTGKSLYVGDVVEIEGMDGLWQIVFTPFKGGHVAPYDMENKTSDNDNKIHFTDLGNKVWKMKKVLGYAQTKGGFLN